MTDLPEPKAEPEATEFEPKHTEMSRHVTSGILNSGVLQVIKTVCQFASVILLSRLLVPEDFGLIAMTGPVVGFLALFQDLGLNQATIQKQNINHEEVNAFFWINVAAGLLLAAILIAVSPLVGSYYHEPRVVTLTAAVGFQIFISGLGNQQSAILTRRMQFGALAVIGTLGSIGGLIAAIVWAWMFRNYWAMYVGSLVGTILPVVAVWVLSGWKPTMPRRVQGLGQMLQFGAGITGSNISNFIARNTDNALIGRAWGDEQLGLYDRAYKLLLFPLQRIIDPMTGVMVPVLSRLTAEPQRYRAIFLKALSQLVLFSWPGIIWTTVLADTVIPTLLGAKWAEAVPMFVPLAMAGLLQIVNNHASWLFISQGRSGELARWAAFNALTSVIAFGIGLSHGAIGVAIAYAASEYIRTPILWWYVTRKGPVKFSDAFKAILPKFAGGIFCGLVLWGCKVAMAGSNPWALLVIGGMSAYAAFTAAMALFPTGRETLKESVKLLTRTLKHVLPRNA